MSKTAWAKKAYFSIILSVPLASLTLEIARKLDIATKYILRREDKELSLELSKLFENEVDSFFLEHKDDFFRRIKINVSLFNGLFPRTWGSFLLQSGVEYQFPVMFNTQNHEEFRENIRSQFPSLKESPMEYKIIDECIISDEGKKFCVQRELEKSYSGFYLCVPQILWGSVSTLFYRVSTLLFPFVGIPTGLFVSVLGNIGLYSYLIKLYKQREEVQFDNSLINKNKIYRKGAEDYLNSCKALHHLIGEKHFGKYNTLLLDKRISNIRKQIAESKVQKRKNIFIENSKRTKL